MKAFETKLISETTEFKYVANCADPSGEAANIPPTACVTGPANSLAIEIEISDIVDRALESGVNIDDREEEMDTGKLEVKIVSASDNPAEEVSKRPNTFCEFTIDNDKEEDRAESRDEIAPASEEALDDTI